MTPEELQDRDALVRVCLDSILELDQIMDAAEMSFGCPDTPEQRMERRVRRTLGIADLWAKGIR